MSEKSYVVITVATGLAVLIGSLLPSASVPSEIPDLDKIVHGGAYLVLGFLTFRSLLPLKAGRIVVALLGTVLCTAFGGIIEFLQGFTGRSPDIVDLLFDAAGAGIGACVSLPVFTRRAEKGNFTP